MALTAVMTNRRRFPALAAALAVASAAACSTSTSGSSDSGPTSGSKSAAPLTITKAAIESKATSSLAAKVGVKPKITCPSDLPAVKGRHEKCVLTAPNGDTVPMTATVTSVKGAHYELYFKVGTKITHH